MNRRQRERSVCWQTTPAGFCGGHTRWRVDSEGRYVSRCERCGTESRAASADQRDLVEEAHASLEGGE